jgi:hypothetical protein
MTKQTINIGTVANDGTGDVLRISFDKVNDNFDELYTNTSYLQSNINTFLSSYDSQQGDFDAVLGLSFDTANAAYGFANAQYDAMNSAYTMANTVNSLFYGAVVNAAAAYNYANGTVVRTNAIYALTNSSFDTVNAAFGLANTINTFAYMVSDNAAAAFNQANLAFSGANVAYDEAAAGVEIADGARINAAAGFGFANGVSVNTAAAYRVANSSYGVTNVAYGAANAVFYKTNSAYTTVNAAYDCANTKVNTVNGIITGLFTVQGDAYVYGNTSLASGIHTADASGVYIQKLITLKADSSTATGTIRFKDSGSVSTYGSITSNSNTFSISTTSNSGIVQFVVNTAAVGYFDRTGLYVTGEIAGFYSDERLKTDIEPIENALDKVEQLRGVTYKGNDLAVRYGFNDTTEQVGLLAQDLKKVLPQVVKPAPFDTDTNGNSLSGEHYKTVQYEKVVPLLVEAIKELSEKVRKLEGK